jgi:hypothetical protein
MSADELKEIARREEREAWAYAVGNLFRYAGVSICLGFVCVLFGFSVGLYAGGLAALAWPACVVLNLWFLTGALAYFSLRDGVLRIFRRLLKPTIVFPSFDERASVDDDTG